MKIEICCGSYRDALVAAKANAKRIELNSALALGGLTPSVATLKLIKAKTDLEVICMVRPRSGGFNYEESEIEECFVNAQALLENGADGIAFGFLKSDRSVDIENVRKMVSLIHNFGKVAVFHRAIDVTTNYLKSIESLVECGVDRILTSGGAAKAMLGLDNLALAQKQYGEKIEIVAGSGVNASNAKMIIKACGVNQIHSSCRKEFIDLTASNEKVTFFNQYEGVDYDLALALVMNSYD